MSPAAPPWLVVGVFWWTLTATLGMLFLVVWGVLRHDVTVPLEAAAYADGLREPSLAAPAALLAVSAVGTLAGAAAVAQGALLGAGAIVSARATWLLARALHTAAGSGGVPR